MLGLVADPFYLARMMMVQTGLPPFHSLACLWILLILFSFFVILSRRVTVCLFGEERYRDARLPNAER